jgi:hypothetical protein
MNREAALAKVGKRLQLNEPLYSDIPVHTTGTVIHANLVHRFADPEYGYADLYELVVAWDLPLCPITTMDESECMALYVERA